MPLGLLRALAFLLCLATVSCVATTKDYDRLSARIHRLEEFQKATQIALKRDTIRLENMANRLKKAMKELRQTKASLFARVDGESDEIRGLTGRLEQLEHQTQKLHSLTTAVKDFVDERFAVSLSPLPKDVPKDAPAVYEYAEKAYKAGRHDTARTVLRHFLKSFPKDNKVPAAMLIIGESYRHQRQYRRAMKEYHALWQQFSNAPEAPRALLYTAKALLDGGQCPKAKQMYKFLIRSYRKKPEAKEAKAELAKLSCK